VAAAGASATNEAHRQQALAEAYEREAALAHDRAARFGLAGVTEKHVAVELAPFSALGCHPLRDPSGRAATVHSSTWRAVGPSGVHVVETKARRRVSIDNGCIVRGQADVG
jgi:hypothetical protein